MLMASKTQKRLFALLNKAGIRARDDRVQLARVLLEDDNIQSFTELSNDEGKYLIELLRGWEWIEQMRMASGVLNEQARLLCEELTEQQDEKENK